MGVTRGMSQSRTGPPGKAPTCLRLRPEMAVQYALMTAETLCCKARSWKSISKETALTGELDRALAA